MTAKRFFGDFEPDKDQPEQKRMKTRPTFASAIKEVVMVNFLHNFATALEPMFRRVVNEEMEHGLRRCARSLTRSSSLNRIQASEQPSSLQLIFNKKLSLPIFTGTKILDVDENPLQILLVDTRGEGKVPISLPYSMKLEIVVLDGDFPSGANETEWTKEEFSKSVLKARAGKRPLLTGGDSNVTMRDGCAVVGDIEFTDNSSWIRSRNFRIGARVIEGANQGLRIREAVTEAFIVKDHRGELYKKHHPPALEDEVWRLEKIGKDGVFHKKLAARGINTVQDFLKLSAIDSKKLRNILGNGMSEKMWDVTLKHAKTCILGSKHYVYSGPGCTLILNPICQVIRAEIDGLINYPNPCRALTTIERARIEDFVRCAYENWSSLKEVEGIVNETALLTQGDLVNQYQNQQQTLVRTYPRNPLPTDGSSHHVGGDQVEQSMYCRLDSGYF